MNGDTLPSFPVDDVTLSSVEHALGGAYAVDPDGTHHLVGADYDLNQLLDFLSGYDEAKLMPYVGEDGEPVSGVCEYPDDLQP